MPKPKRKTTPQPIERLDGPTEAQLANGHYTREDIIHADYAQRATVHVNRGGTPVDRWRNSERLTERQHAAIKLCQSYWRVIDQSPPVTSQYGERIKSTGCEDLRAARWLTANGELMKFQGYVSKSAWNVYQNVCRWDMPAGVAGGELGYGSRGAEVRAHTLVCEVADRIVEKEKL